MEFEHLKGKLSPSRLKKQCAGNPFLRIACGFLQQRVIFYSFIFLIGGQLLDGYQLDYLC